MTLIHFSGKTFCTKRSTFVIVVVVGGGGTDAEEKIIAKLFSPPFQTSKDFRSPNFCHENYEKLAHRKANKTQFSLEN